ncbi:hypothetical protein JQC92_04285 [Shewanella sp. 202IG2-18]|uniref:hypothetical protein n=1 Tax=Parashewanella hymeniacidonis TaxID=2807618 RepID=UPI00195F9FE9|nr:hypothetical protein [Parashewanella hymeniacidonis]MBM7071259.1 hypothetical protein [Parashewanella hymeniacidonis]
MTNILTMQLACHAKGLRTVGIHYLGLIPQKHFNFKRELALDRNESEFNLDSTYDDVYKKYPFWGNEWAKYRQAQEASDNKGTAASEAFSQFTVTES